jgi:non-ribosomal peptide synthetase component F
MTLLAGLCALLAQYTGQDDLVVGSVIANRDRADVERLIGFVANTLVLRIDTSGSPSFRELLARVRETCLDGYAQQVPPEKLVEALAAQRGSAKTAALYQAWFQLEAASHEHLQLGGLEVTSYDVRPPDTTFELSLVLVENPTGITGAFEYDAEVFDDDTVRQVADHFTALLRQVITSPAIALHAIALSVPLQPDAACDFSAAL